MLLITIASALAEDGASGFTLREIWEHSGALARAVIVTLILMLVATVIIAIERTLAYRAATGQSKQLAATIVPALQAGDVHKALGIAKDEQFKAAYLGGLLRAGLAEVAARRDAHGVHNAERAVAKAAGQELAKLKRGMPVLATVGSTAPFVGLFGTTFGVINAFQGMATAGSGLASISAGISEALITTGVGIGVAVVGVWLFNYFNHRIEKVTEELASSEADFMDWAEKLLQDAPAAADAAK